MADVSLGSFSSVLVVSLQGSKYTASACSVPYRSAHFVSFVGGVCVGGGGMGGSLRDGGGGGA